MNADPDALRRAADEMDELIARQAAHLGAIDRLQEDVRKRAAKIHEVRIELRRAGYPVDECDWPTDALRQLVDAHIALKAKPWSDAPITMALCSLLGDCRPAEIVGRVRDLARRLEAAESDCAGLVATTDTLRRERDDIRATLAKCHIACNSAGITIRTDVSERVHHMAAELASLRKKEQATKPTTPNWAGPYLLTDDGHRYWVSNVASGYWVGHSASGGKTAGCGADETSARRLAELLAGFDPGGVWRVAGEPVSADVVKAVCPTVAVSWGPA